MRIISIIYICFVSVFANVLSGCSSESVSTIRIGTNVWPGYEPLYLARSLEKWPEKHIKLVEYPSATEVIRAFRNHSIEAASLTLDEVLLLRQDNIPITVVLVHDISAGGDAIVAKPEIQNVKQLKGKKVAVESNALGAFVITRALQINGLNSSDISIYPADVNLHESVYKSGEVDAVVTFEPVRTKLLNAGAIEIFNSNQMPNEIVDVLVVHNDYLKNNPQQVKKLILGWFNAVRHLKESPQASATIISKRLKVTPEEVLSGYEGLHIPNIEQNHALLKHGEAKLNITVKKLYKVLLENQLIREGVNLDDMFSSEYLPKE